jgi:hypothetical protein
MNDAMLPRYGQAPVIEIVAGIKFASQDAEFFALTVAVANEFAGELSPAGMARLLDGYLPLLRHIDFDEQVWRTFSPGRHVRWGAEDADVQTQDEGPVSETQRYSIKPAALDFRGDGASVWRKEVLRAAEVDIDDVVVGEYLGVL